MSDLISRKALVHGLMEDYEQCMTFDGLLNYIHNQPIAFDVNEVSEKLFNKYKMAIGSGDRQSANAFIVSKSILEGGGQGE